MSLALTFVGQIPPVVDDVVSLHQKRMQVRHNLGHEDLWVVSEKGYGDDDAIVHRHNDLAMRT